MKKKFKFLRYRPLKAFSLVEMLMALLVASLLLAALAPVMTRRMADHELKVMSESAQYDKDSIVTIFTNSAEQQEFNIPQDTNRVTVTMMGGGGAGGNALYGNKTFTSNGTFKVPEGVTKLRVFMIGGGGGGASGGLETAWQTADIPALNNAEGKILSAGNYTFASGIAPPNNYISPELDNKCKISNISDRWTIVSNNETISPDTKFTKFLDNTNITLNKVTACGGGGGGEVMGGGKGGSGGYIKDMVLNKQAPASKISLGVGAGGGTGLEAGDCTTSNVIKYAAGGHGGTGWNGLSGQAGGQGWAKVQANPCAESTGGGGGGGATGGGYNNEVWFIAPGGGGAGGSHHGHRFSNASWGKGGKGGNGGGTNAGLGGGGIWRGGTDWRAGAGGTGYVAGLTGANSATQYVYGGGGGAGIGGIGGGYGDLSSIFGTNYCNAGRIGAIHLWYSASTVKNGLKCEYYKKSNAGGGGAAGQITIGEINVTPDETLTFEIGAGGLAQNASGQNGNHGKATYIKRGTNVVISANGGYGGEYSNSETTPSQGGSFRNPVIGVNWTGIDYKNNNSYAAGSNGALAADTSYGGSGGFSQDIKGNLVSGGAGGNSSKDGLSPAANNYGAGGGGGSGSNAIGDNTFGKGGAGAGGMIYIEWGGSNGGGGTMGEFVQKTITNLEQNDRKMIINIGKGGDISSNGGKGGDTSISVKSGGRNITLTARGGVKGEDGHADKGSHGGEIKYPDNYSDLYKEFVTENMNIIKGQKADNEYGGAGGYINCMYKSKDGEGNIQCAQSIKSNDGLDTAAGPIRPGCGGTSITAPLYNAICIPYSASANQNGGNGTFGAGGGGGAVFNNTQGKGGKGGDGFVILEYKSVL